MTHKYYIIKIKINTSLIYLFLEYFVFLFEMLIYNVFIKSKKLILHYWTLKITKNVFKCNLLKIS
jgi:hypothetical protein